MTRFESIALALALFGLGFVGLYAYYDSMWMEALKSAQAMVPYPPEANWATAMAGICVLLLGALTYCHERYLKELSV